MRKYRGHGSPVLDTRTYYSFVIPPRVNLVIPAMNEIVIIYLEFSIKSK